MVTEVLSGVPAALLTRFLAPLSLPDSLIAGTPCAGSDLICLQLPKCIWLAQDMPAADSLLLQQLNIQEDVALIN